MAGLSRLFGDGLHNAAKEFNLDKVEQCVRQGCDINKQAGKDKVTALHIACSYGYEPIVNYLLDRQASAFILDAAGNTPLHAAVISGRPTCVAALLGPRNKSSESKQRLLSQRNQAGDLPISVAAASGNQAVLEQLLAAPGADPNAADSAGRAPIHIAAAAGHAHIIALLCSRGANVDARVRETSATGESALHVAAAAGQILAVEALLRAGASLRAVDNRGKLPVEVAHAAGHTEVYRRLKTASQGGSAGGVPEGVASAPSSHQLYNTAPGPSFTMAFPGQPPVYATPPAGPPYGPAGRYSYTAGPGAPVPLMAPAGAFGGSPAPAAVPPQRSAASGIVIPKDAPAAVAYPTLPDGAGVYY